MQHFTLATNAKVRCRFWTVVFTVSEAEDENAYDLLREAFIDKTGVNPVKVSTCAAKVVPEVVSSYSQMWCAA